MFVADGAIVAGDDVITKETAQPFADASATVDDAVINRGYKIDYHCQIGEMLKRTARKERIDRLVQVPEQDRQG